MSSKLFILALFIILGNNSYSQLYKKTAISGSLNFNVNKQKTTLFSPTTGTPFSTYTDNNFYIESSLDLGYFIKKNFLIGTNLGGFYHHQTLNSLFYNSTIYGFYSGVLANYYLKLGDKYFCNFFVNPYYVFSKNYGNDTGLDFKNIVFNNFYLKSGIGISYFISKNVGLSFGFAYTTRLENKLLLNISTTFLINK